MIQLESGKQLYIQEYKYEVSESIAITSHRLERIVSVCFVAEKTKKGHTGIIPFNGGAWPTILEI